MARIWRQKEGHEADRPVRQPEVGAYAVVATIRPRHRANPPSAPEAVNGRAKPDRLDKAQRLERARSDADHRAATIRLRERRADAIRASLPEADRKLVATCGAVGKMSSDARRALRRAAERAGVVEFHGGSYAKPEDGRRVVKPLR